MEKQKEDTRSLFFTLPSQVGIFSVAAALGHQIAFLWLLNLDLGCIIGLLSHYEVFSFLD
jgi:hypothetical protein